MLCSNLSILSSVLIKCLCRTFWGVIGVSLNSWSLLEIAPLSFPSLAFKAKGVLAIASFTISLSCFSVRVLERTVRVLIGYQRPIGRMQFLD